MMIGQRVDIVVVGGGAAGLASAIFAAQTIRASGRAVQVAIVDGARRMGAKILVSGGGRCNVTNAQVVPTDFNGREGMVRAVLRSFDHRRARAWFEEMGVPLVEEASGKLFPRSQRASDVLRALLARCAHLGVRILPQHRVVDIDLSPSDGFLLQCGSGEVISARRAIVATGGCALPRSGSDGRTFALLRRLGHRVTSLFPALVPLCLDAAFFHGDLAGTSLPAELSVWLEGRRLRRVAGDLLFTHAGISGPACLDISRHYLATCDGGDTAELRMSCCPGQGFDAVDTALSRAAAASPRRAVATALSSDGLRPLPNPPSLSKALALALCAHAEVPADLRLCEMSRPRRRALAHVLTSLVLPVVGSRGYRHAEVTAGGVCLDEVEAATMGSRRVPGLHLAGEVLDCDGRIGGFNFQWAWSTGYLAGVGAARAILAEN